MTDMTLWQVGIDGALVASLLYMCFRFSRSNAGSSVDLGQLRTLETSLRRLVQEGERASGTLGSELSKRQHELEQLLFDLETVEGRVNKAMDEATEVRKQLRQSLSRVSTEDRPLEPAPQQHYTAPEPVTPSDQYNSIPEPPSFENLSATDSYQTEQVQQVSQPQQHHAVNIYGEPIESPEDTGERTLIQSIEREVIHEERDEMKQSLEDLYGAADDLLRAGQSLENVSRATSLPLDEVKMLSQIIAREEAVQSPGGSPVRRGTQVL